MRLREVLEGFEYTLYDCRGTGITQPDETEKALELQIKANTIMNALCDVGLIPAIKYVLSTMGIDVGVPRRPFHDLTSDQKTALKKVVEENLLVG